ncbi:gluconolactonase [Actinoalloteichus hymeniacidonis]|uniref:Gluconolactonase n=1 Tax=Actinoalloteichus hymeniacidonis TaxID=340345 RepID=A0AAC9HMS8_9PSEU|nr:gluconolactonase [Actinoalloteichus hymeniacidonis]
MAVAEAADVGACPTWDITAESLLWVDTPNARVHRYQPITGDDATMDLPQRVGAARPRVRGGLVANLREGIALIDSDDTRRWLVFWGRPDAEPGTAAVDPAGRLWAGSHMNTDTPPSDDATGVSGRGWLASVEQDGAVTTPVRQAAEITGMAWSPDQRSMYLIERGTGRIDVVDVERDSGSFTGRRTLCEVTDVAGEPSGLCTDADGCLWVAIRGGAAIHRYTPEGVLDQRFALPAAQPTGACFGGFGFTDLYITTARTGGDAGSALAQDGSLLVIPDVGTGLPDTLFLG